MSTLFLIFLSTLVISLISFIGVITLFLKKSFFEKILIILVSLSAGALMGGAFLHLMPEALEKAEEIHAHDLFLYFLAGFVLFFMIEKILHWRHCHKADCSVHTFAYMNLIGDIVHNFIDGLIIAASFIVNPVLGLTTSIAVAFHEIPQEIGDFGVLVYGGFKKSKALILNFLVALFAVAGGIIGYFFIGYFEHFAIIILPITAGGFVYIAASDLIPEIRKQAGLSKNIISFLFFLAGIFIMHLLNIIFH